MSTGYAVFCTSASAFSGIGPSACTRRVCRVSNRHCVNSVHNSESSFDSIKIQVSVKTFNYSHLPQNSNLDRKFVQVIFRLDYTYKSRVAGRSFCGLWTIIMDYEHNLDHDTFLRISKNLRFYQILPNFVLFDKI